MSSLFGSKPLGQSSTPNAQGTGGGSSLFGNMQNNNASTSNAQPAGSSLFGNTQDNNTSSNPQPAGSSLFGNMQNNSTNNQSSGLNLFGSTQNKYSNAAAWNQQGNQQQNFQPQQTQQSAQMTELANYLQFGIGGSGGDALSQHAQQELIQNRLNQMGLNVSVRDKPVIKQIQTLVRKWDPNSQDTLLQTYLYNAVTPALAPFYQMGADENEKDWETALANKPANLERKDGDNVSFVPVLVRGFKALGERAEFQAKSINDMRMRLHEMNNSIDAVMEKHQQVLTVRLDNVRRQHVALSQRCLRLAVKAQVLRSRGYALDAGEEGLRKTLQALERKVFDPSFGGREEEIWARMVGLRERARWLDEEGKRLGQQAEEEKRQGVPQEVLLKTKRVLRDYEGQLAHLANELADVRKEFEEWERGTEGK